MAIVTYDTSVLIAYRPTQFPAGYRMSAVVIQEMTAGASGKAEVKLWEATMRLYEASDRLLVPTSEDWFLAGKVLYALLQGLKSQARGQTPRLPANEKQRIIRDVLIARTAKRVGALLVTDNLKDFERIKRFCAVRTVSGADYFKPDR
jgi:predicted nucleic acid-binding protein